jgi:hypothetical protein
MATHHANDAETSISNVNMRQIAAPMDLKSPRNFDR